MARPPKPTAMHEASGAYKKNPNRKRNGEAKPRMGIGQAPVSRATDFSDVWDEIVSAVPPGVLGNTDRLHLEITCNLVCEYRRNPEEFPGYKMSEMNKMLGKLGMNPIDRIRITVPEQEEKSKEDEYF
jgi:hypothetical protein